MTTTNKGLDIIKSEDSTIYGATVILTRKTTKSGKIRHGVVLEKNGRHQLIGSFLGLSDAFKAYKALVKC